MKCLICGKECHEAYLNLGAFCGEEHRLEVLRRHHAYLDELRREEPLRMPEAFGVPDFDRFSPKLAVFLLDRISEEVRDIFRRRAPSLLEPVAMALELKERILRQLPDSHVEMEEAVGLTWLFYSGTYRFRQPVPAAMVVEAIRKAQLLPLLGVDDAEQGGQPDGNHSQEGSDRPT